jgi:DmsE family decaheme c-type cytochrome
VKDNDDPTGIPFRPETPAAVQNGVCLECHQGGMTMHWVGSTHESRGLSCVECHTIHVGEERGGDPILSKNQSRTRTFNAQAKVCFGCHKEQRAQAYRISAHPIRYGQMGCSDCHSPHGAPGPMQLVKPTLNETCYTCHAEKRGPFLWEHAPARENCADCHSPHGSNHQALLKTRGPWLCQQCHQANYHPSTAYNGSQLVPAAGGDSSKLQAKNCMNCHFEVHGSNHPSGVRWTR